MNIRRAQGRLLSSSQMSSAPSSEQTYTKLKRFPEDFCKAAGIHFWTIAMKSTSENHLIKAIKLQIIKLQAFNSWMNCLFYCSVPSWRIWNVLTAVCFEMFTLSGLTSSSPFIWFQRSYTWWTPRTENLTRSKLKSRNWLNQLCVAAFSNISVSGILSSGRITSSVIVAKFLQQGIYICWQKEPGFVKK